MGPAGETRAGPAESLHRATAVAGSGGDQNAHCGALRVVYTGSGVGDTPPPDDRPDTIHGALLNLDGEVAGVGVLHGLQGSDLDREVPPICFEILRLEHSSLSGPVVSAAAKMLARLPRVSRPPRSFMRPTRAGMDPPTVTV